MAQRGPAKVVLSRHAERRLAERGLVPTDVAELVLARHKERQRNRGAAEWIIRARGTAVAYDWPDGDDETTALVITAWRE